MRVVQRFDWNLQQQILPEEGRQVDVAILWHKKFRFVFGELLVGELFWKCVQFGEFSVQRLIKFLKAADAGGMDVSLKIPL